MPLDFRNTNTLWASILVETFQRLGLKAAVICPGSRSAPLAVAFAQHPQIEAIPILDERSAAFFALGMAKRTGLPVVVACTSGTAAANFYPAVIEARESQVPLLLLTADRPPELRHCHAGQAIDQVKLYGHYPNWQAELAVPSPERQMGCYLRQIVIQAWERCQFPACGPVHLNLPFREPLAPVLEPAVAALEADFAEEDFFAAVSAPCRLSVGGEFPLPPEWQVGGRGLIIAGAANPECPQQYCQAIGTLSQVLQYPVLADALSPLRNYGDLLPNLIAAYDLILRNEKLAEILAPKIVIQLGELPTSKELRAWLGRLQPRRWLVDGSGENLDPLQGKTVYLRVNIESLSPSISPDSRDFSDFYCQWQVRESQGRKAIETTMRSLDFLLEGKAAWLLSQVLPPDTPLFIANSMPIRNMEFFWLPNNRRIVPFFNRGANGIDGTLSTALGIAHCHQSSVMLAGDLAFLHDTNGLLLKNKFKGHLTVVLINNNGGGIFEMLPISQFDSFFEDFFATPQDLDFSRLCTVYNISHVKIEHWKQLEEILVVLPTQGIRILELQTNRKKDAVWLQKNLKKLADNISLI